MEIKPPSSGKLAAAQQARPNIAPQDQGTQAGSDQAAAAGRDGIELSEAARKLLAQGASEAPPAGTLSPERLSDLSRKIAEGFYDRDDVQDAVSRRILPDLPK